MAETRRPVPSKQSRNAIPLPAASPQPEQKRWVSLREAEDLTGIPWSTIRNWARKQRIDSRFELDESGDRRLVELTEVISWADHLGRQHRVLPDPEAATRDSRPATRDPESATGQAEPATPDPQPATREPEPPTRDPRPTTPDPRPATRDPELPEGTMLVPLDAWNKMLNQLGNLHQAGQQLAEARERAAKAETEVTFLRERLAELRKQQPKPETAAPPVETPPAGPDETEKEFDPLWVDLYRRWNRRRRRR